jgi:deoxyribodipyrimidine photo-lyase
MAATPDLRLSLIGDGPVRRDGALVLYWMTAARRTHYNYALDRAVGWARDLTRPLVILEDLRSGRRWDADRFHRFVLDGMADAARRLADKPLLYYPYAEPAEGDADGLVPALAERACVVVTDAYPCSYWPEVVAAAAGEVGVRMEQVDSCGLLPMLAAEKTFKTAASFRRFLQASLPEHLAAFPTKDPLADLDLPRLEALPKVIAQRWPAADEALLAGDARALADLDIDHGVGTAPATGGETAATRTLRTFLRNRLDRYLGGARHPDDEATSDLSPYLRHGHVGVHRVFDELADAQNWSSDRLAPEPTGKREGWWGMGENAEAFLDELVTWREIGYNFCYRRDDFGDYDSLPDWARETLADHAGDPRPETYSLEQLTAAQTADPLWNAAQTQLVRTGRLHNYMRMLWGKKILEWSPSPEAATERMIELNNRYALDGRDPNSYTGIFWCLGRYDRPWGPERPIFGKVRYMTSESTRRKLHLARYLDTYAPNTA